MHVTAALRTLTANLNPHRYQLLYLAETDFGRLDLYRTLAQAMGLEPAYRRAQLWRDLKNHIEHITASQSLLPVWIIDEAQNLPPKICSPSGWWGIPTSPPYWTRSPMLR